MDIQRINQYKNTFDSIVKTISDDNQNQVEVWFGRELQGLLGYARWENFSVAINRAIESCKSQGVNVDDHFREVTKMVIYKANISNVFYYYFHRSFHNQLRISISFSIALVNPS